MKEVDEIRRRYPVGMRIELEQMDERDATRTKRNRRPCG